MFHGVARVGNKRANGGIGHRFKTWKKRKFNTKSTLKHQVTNNKTSSNWKKWNTKSPIKSQSIKLKHQINKLLDLIFPHQIQVNHWKIAPLKMPPEALRMCGQDCQASTWRGVRRGVIPCQANCWRWRYSESPHLKWRTLFSLVSTTECFVWLRGEDRLPDACKNLKLIYFERKPFQI